MSRRVFLHIGLPKTGTTYLQSIAWSNRERLRADGVLLPGFGPRQHLWGSGVVREEDRLERRHRDAPASWGALVEELAGWDGDGLISHEFLCGASAEQAERAIADLAPAEVHVIVTAREIVGLITARWQEWVKNGATGEIDAYPAKEKFRPADEWGWGTLDLAEVLQRWGGSLPPERVHLICPPGADDPADALWRRFAGVLGVQPEAYDLGAASPNTSLGVVEVETLRRINRDLSGFKKPVDRGRWIRGYLAEERLVPRDGERFWPSEARVAELRARGEAGLVTIEQAAYDVVGSLDLLRTPAVLPERRHPSSVTDAEVADAATTLVGEMLDDIRSLTRAAKAERGDSHAPEGDRVRRLIGRLRNRP